MGNHHSDRTALRRRRIIQAGGMAGVAGIAGCLGDDEPDDADDVADADDADEPAPTDDTDDGDDTVPADDSDDADDEEPTTELPDIHDATAVWVPHDFADLPPDIQFNPYVDPSVPLGLQPFRPHPLIALSHVDFQHHGHVVDDWSYQPGVLEFSLHEDFYWWSGEQVTIDDYLSQIEFRDFHWGGDELDGHEEIVSLERIDDFSARLSLSDTWHETWAISQTLEEYLVEASRMFYEPWNEQFADAPDLDTVQDIRDDVEEDIIDSDDELAELFFNPYELRLDGSVGQVGEDFWEFELVREKNGNLRHFANPDNYEHLPNFERYRIEVHEEPTVVGVQRLQDQDQPYAVGGATPAAIDMYNDGEYPFDVDLHITRQAQSDIGGIQFNHAVHPSDDPRFRRAFAYLTDNTAWTGYPEVLPLERYHPFFTDEELEQNVSEEVIDAFTDYGYDGMQLDEAEAELEAGGYERNADGDWILQADGAEGDAGEPMEFTIGTHSWMDWLAEHGTDWYADLEEFGISTEILLELPADWTVAWTYTGGGSPDAALANVFLDDDWARPEMSIPATIQAPEFLETTDAGGPMDGWVEYDVGAMTDRLPVTTDAEMHQQLVDELTWVVNQTCNHYSVSPRMVMEIVNQERWHFPDPEETPEQRNSFLFRAFPFFQYVPEDER